MITLRIKYLHILLVTIAFLIGIVVANLLPLVSAHGGNTANIHGCISTLDKILRVVGASDSCDTGETAVDWQQFPESGTQFPLICPNCSVDDLAGFASRIKGKNLTNSYLNNVNMSASDLSDTNFTDALLKGVYFNTDNLTGVNFTGADLTSVIFDDADLTGATGMGSATVTGVSWSNTTCPDGTNSDSHSNTCVGHF